MAQVIEVDKGFVPTKGIGKQGHRPRSSVKPIKPQVVPTSNGHTPRNMNFDFEIEQASQTEAYGFIPSPPKPPAMDMVDWANSQPVALRSLYLEATKRPEKRPIKPETTWPTYEEHTFNSAASGSFEHTAARPRPLRRTNSSQRARLGPDSASASKPPPAPVDPLWGDRLAVLAACQNVSERMDENALLHVGKSGDGGPSKRKAKAPHLAAVSKTRRASMPISLAQRQETNRCEKGKQRESFSPDVSTRGIGRSSHLSSSSSSFSSSTSVSSPVIPSCSPHTADTSLTMDSADTSMMDVDVEDKHDSTQAGTTGKESTCSKRSTTSSLIPGEQVNHTVPAPKLHPLLTQKHLHRPGPVKVRPIPQHHPHSHAAPVPPPPHQNVPALSQSTRPPALGMRRGHSMPVPAQHTLPTRQKGFKPPLLSQPLPQPAAPKAKLSPHQKPESSRSPVESGPAPHPHLSAPSEVSAWSTTPQAEEKRNAKYGMGSHSRPAASRPFHYAVVESKDEQPRPPRSPSPAVNPDPDSSFGDMSFDMDALETTMQMYD